MMYIFYFWIVECVIVVSDFIFFFKQKTAYEMRISDWSSDVCSSDLAAVHEGAADARATVLPSSLCESGVSDQIRRCAPAGRTPRLQGQWQGIGQCHRIPGRRARQSGADLRSRAVFNARQLHAQDRQRVAEGKSVSVRVDHGCRCV